MKIMLLRLVISTWYIERGIKLEYGCLLIKARSKEGAYCEESA